MARLFICVLMTLISTVSFADNSQLLNELDSAIARRAGYLQAKEDRIAYIKKNISKILPYFIDLDDYETVKALFESGKFVTKRNIMRFQEYAIAHTQSRGDIQIQAYITDYRNKHFPDSDPLKNMKI